MTSRRCPKCRTFCDTDRDARCFACGEALPASAINRPQIDETVHQEATRDYSASRIILAVIGALGGLSFFSNLRGGLGLIVPAGLLVVAVIAGLLLGPRAAGQALVQVLSVVGVVVLILGAIGFGLVILVFVICAAGGMRIAG